MPFSPQKGFEGAPLALKELCVRSMDGSSGARKELKWVFPSSPSGVRSLLTGTRTSSPTLLIHSCFETLDIPVSSPGHLPPVITRTTPWAWCGHPPSRRHTEKAGTWGPVLQWCHACSWTHLSSSNKIRRNCMGLKITACMHSWGNFGKETKKPNCYL